MLVEQVLHFDGMHEASRQPVELPHDDHVHLATLR